MSPMHWDVLARQFLNSLVVAGIAALSLYGSGQEARPQAPAIAFGLTFLIEMRNYLNINGKRNG